MGELIKFGTSGADFGGGATGLVINETVFQGLPKNDQEVIVQVGDEFTESNSKLFDDYSRSTVQEYKDNGVEIYELSADEKAQCKKFYSEIEENHLKEKRNLDLEATLKTFREEVKKQIIYIFIGLKAFPFL